MLAGCTNIHGEEVVDSLRAETLSIELSECGSNGTEPSRGFLHCCLFTKNNRNRFAVILDVKMSSECLSSNSWEMGSGQDALHTWISEGWSSRLTDLVAADQDKCISETLWLDPKVPVIEVGKELGTIIEQSAEISQHESCDRVDGSSKATGRERASLINSTVGTDLGIRGLEVYPVLCGASVPSGEKAARSGSVCSMLLSMSRRETVWKAALRSRATSTRVGSASARYWMVLIMVLAPSGRPTPY